MVKVLVIGIDGASWNFLENWIKEGKLPTVKRLIESGVWGDLQSCVYYFTSPSWKCYSTGKNPGKLGAFSFWTFDKNKKISLNLSTSFRSEEVWDILGRYGYRCGIVNVPFTYPPKKINGVMIAGFPGIEREYTYPPELQEELGKYSYRISPTHSLAYGAPAVSEIRSLIEKRFSVSRYILNNFDLDFFQVVIFYTDKIQHDYWKAMEEKDLTYGNVIQNCWELIDKEIVKLLKIVGDECYVFMVSDHGFTALKGVMKLNQWLIEKGLLRLRKGCSKIEKLFNFFEKINISRKLILKIAVSSQHFMRLIHTIFPEQVITKIGEKLYSREKGMGIVSIIDNVDWNETKAICIAENCVYMIGSDKEYSNIKDRLVEEIKNITDPRTGEKIVQAIKTREDIYFGNYVHLAPDLVIIPKDGYRFYDGLTDGLWDFSRKPWSGYHRLHGLFLAKGPTIKTGSKIDNATIYDVAPTILHIFSVPSPEDMDGHVMRQIFKTEKAPKKDNP